MATPKQIITNQRQIDAARAAQEIARARVAQAEAAKSAFAAQSTPIIIKNIQTATQGISNFNRALRESLKTGKSVNQIYNATRDIIAQTKTTLDPLRTELQGIESEITRANTILGGISVPAPEYQTIMEEERTLARDTFKNTLALFFGAAEAAKPWTDALYNVVNKFYKTGSTIDESFNLALLDARNNPELEPFTNRFKGIYALQDLKQAGKPVLIPTIAEYVVSQAKMSDIFSQAGLGDLATEDFTSDLIGKGNSVSTVADKIAQVYNRIDLAPTAIKNTISRYFPTVDRATLARTILTGTKGTQQLVDELAKYEVLAAAEQQGIAATGLKPITGGVTEERAGEYARMGQTFGSLMPKFAQVARETPTVSKLAGISRREDIGQVGVERALITSSAKELSELERLAMEEEARFRGSSGLAQTGLASQRRANRAF
jgi:hypothetical protein